MSKNKINKNLQLTTKSLNISTTKKTFFQNNKLFRYNIVFVALSLIILTCLAYSTVFSNGFISFDDNVYITKNTQIQQGLSWENVKWALTSVYGSNWHPLTWLSHMTDIQLFGLNPVGHHFMNLFYHILAMLLLFGFLRYATKSLWLSAFVAALFALHPAHVESVAWAAERKDVLSTVFFFATLWAYSFYARRPHSGKYVLVVILFALGLLAKPMLVTLPFVLLLLDYWPLQRLIYNKKRLYWLVIEKLPLLIMTGISSIITIIAQQEAIGGLSRIVLPIRISNAIISYCVYIGQAFWPVNLAVFYPYNMHPSILNIVGCSLLLLAITVAVAWKGRQEKHLVTGWFWFVITLLPVIGIIQVGDQAHADRYTYIPFIGLFILVSWGLFTHVGKMSSSKNWLVMLTITAVIFVLTIITRMQVTYWKNDLTIFTHASNVTKNNIVAFSNLGAYYEKIDRSGEAVIQYQKVLKVDPNDEDALYNLGVMCMHLGRVDDAIIRYKKVLEINPNNIKALNNIAAAFVQKNLYPNAIPFVQKALSLAKAAGDEPNIRQLTANLEVLKKGNVTIQEKQF